MARIPLIAFLLVFPFLAQAQQAVVLSGEHDGFSRLVAPLPRGANWQVTQSGRSVQFQVIGFTDRFDVSDVFQLISRDRVKTISAQPDGFSIDLGCDCRVAPFVAQERFVVLDIASPGVDLPVPFIPISEESQAITDAPEPKPQEVPIVVSDATQIPTLIPRQVTTPPSAILAPMELPTLARKPLSDIEQEVLDEIQKRLAREVGTAATRGVLTPIAGPLAATGVPQQTGQMDPTETAADIERPDAVEGLINNVRITTSNDVSLLEQEVGERQSLSGFVCPSNAEVDLGSWATETPFHDAMGNARRQLYQEFDKLDTKVALALARIYVHYGFGAEARQVLSLDPDLLNSQRLLLDIALIMEVGHAPTNSILHSLLDCDTDVALWAMLAREELTIARSIDPSAALLSLNKLPTHLRKFLAPALSRRLLSHGDADAAATALRSLERLPSALPSAAKLEKAKIEIDQGELSAGSATLADVIDDNAVESPEALIALVDARLAANQPIESQTAVLIEAFAKELQGDALGPDLRRAHVLALVKSGQFDRAFNATSELGGDSEDDAAVSLRLKLLHELTKAADDVVFLDRVFDQSPRDLERLPIVQKIELAERLLSLGFAIQANEVVTSIPSRPRNDLRQLLAARIALNLGQPLKVESALSEMDGQEIDILRAQAKEMEGDHAAAFQLFYKSDQTEEANRAAWLSEEWLSLPTENNDLFGGAASLVDAAIEPSAETEGMLARSTAALEESEQARQTLLNLLQAPELVVPIAQ